MPFDFTLSEEAKEVLSKLSKKDPFTAEIIGKKIKQIIACDIQTIDHYKNLKNELSDYKRVHVAKSFVLMFKVYKKENFILFNKIKHHDDAYN